MTSVHALNPDPRPEGSDVEIERMRREVLPALKQAAVQFEETRDSWNQQKEELVKQNAPDHPFFPNGNAALHNMEPMFFDAEPWGLDEETREKGSYVTKDDGKASIDTSNLASYWNNFTADRLIDGVLGKDFEPVMPLAKFPAEQRRAMSKYFQQYVQDRIVGESIARWSLKKIYGDNYLGMLADQGKTVGNEVSKYGQMAVEALVDTVVMEPLTGLREAVGLDRDAEAQSVAVEWAKKSGVATQFTGTDGEEYLRNIVKHYTYQLRGLDNPVAAAVSQSIGTALGFLVPYGGPALTMKLGGKMASGMVYGLGGKLATKLGMNKVATTGAELVKKYASEGWMHKIANSRLAQGAVHSAGGGALYEMALSSGSLLDSDRYENAVVGAEGFTAAHLMMSSVDAMLSKWVPKKSIAKVLATVAKSGKGGVAGAIFAHMPSFSRKIMAGELGEQQPEMLEIGVQWLRHMIDPSAPAPSEEQQQQYLGAVLGSASMFGTMEAAKSAMQASRFSRTAEQGASLRSLAGGTASERQVMNDLLMDMFEVKWVTRGSAEAKGMTPEDADKIVWRGQEGFYVVNKDGQVPDFGDFATPENLRDLRLWSNKVIYEALLDPNPAKVFHLGDGLAQMGKRIGENTWRGQRYIRLGRWVNKLAGKTQMEDVPIMTLLRRAKGLIPGMGGEKAGKAVPEVEGASRIDTNPDVSVPTARIVVTKGQAKEAARIIVEKLQGVIPRKPGFFSSKAPIDVDPVRPGGGKNAPAGREEMAPAEREGAAPTDGVFWDARPTAENLPVPSRKVSQEGWDIVANNDAAGMRRIRASYVGNEQTMGGVSADIVVRAGGYSASLSRGKENLGATKGKIFSSLLANIEETGLPPEQADSLRTALVDYLAPGDTPGDFGAAEWLVGRSAKVSHPDPDLQIAAADAAVDAAPIYAKDPEAASQVVTTLRGAAQVAEDPRAAEALEDAAEIIDALGAKESPLALEMDAGPESIDNLQDALEQTMASLPGHHRLWQAKMGPKGWTIKPEHDPAKADIVISRDDLRNASPDKIRMALEGTSLRARGEIDPSIIAELEASEQIKVVEPQLAIALPAGDTTKLAQALGPYIGKSISSEFANALLEMVRRNDPGVRVDTALLLARKLHPPGSKNLELAGAMSPGERAIIAFSEHAAGENDKTPEERMERVIHEFLHHHTLNLPPAKKEELRRAVDSLVFPESQMNSWEKIAYYGSSLIAEAANTGELKNVLPAGKKQHLGIQLHSMRDQNIVREWLDGAVQVFRAEMDRVDLAIKQLDGRHPGADKWVHPPGYGETLISYQAELGDLAKITEAMGRFPTRDELVYWHTIYQTLNDFLTPAKDLLQSVDLRKDEMGVFYSLLGGPKMADMIADIERTGLSPSIKRQLIDDLSSPIRQAEGAGLGVLDYQNQSYPSIDAFFDSPWRKKVTKAFALDPRKRNYVQAIEAEQQVWNRLKETGWVKNADLAKGMDGVTAADHFTSLIPVDVVVGGNQKTGGYAVSLPIIACDPAIGKYTCCADCYVICTPSKDGPVYNRININNDAKVVNRMKLMHLINTNPDGAAILITRGFLKKAFGDAVLAAKTGIAKLSPRAVQELSEIHDIWMKAYKGARMQGGKISSPKLKMDIDKIPIDEILAGIGKAGDVLNKVKASIARKEIGLGSIKEQVKELEKAPQTPEVGKKLVELQTKIDAINRKHKIQIAKLTNAYHVATSDTTLKDGWAPYLRFLDSGEVGNMQTVRAMNGVAQLLTQFNVEVQLFTRRPAFGQYLLHPNVFVVNSMDLDAKTIFQSARNDMAKVFLLSSHDPAEYDRMLTAYKELSRLNKIKNPMGKIVTLFPPHHVLKDRKAFSEILDVFASHGMPSPMDKVCPCDANYNPLPGSCIMCRQIGKRCSGQRSRRVKMVHDGRLQHGVHRSLAAGEDLFTLDLAAHPDEPYRADLFEFAATDLPAELWASTFIKTEADKATAQNMVEAISRLEEIHQHLPVFSATYDVLEKKARKEFLTASKMMSSIGEMPREERPEAWAKKWSAMVKKQKLTWGKSPISGFLSGAEALALAEVSKQLGPQGMAAWINATRLALGQVDMPMVEEANLWNGKFGKDIAGSIASAFKVKTEKSMQGAMLNVRNKISKQQEIRKAKADLSARAHLLPLGAWASTPFWAETDSGQNLPPMHRLLDVATSLLEVKRLILDGVPQQAAGLLREAKGAFQAGTDLPALMSGHPLYKQVESMFKDLRLAARDKETQEERFVYYMVENGPAEDSMPAEVARLNEELRFGKRRIPQLFHNLVKDMVSYEPTFLSFEEQASRPWKSGSIHRFLGEPSLLYGDELVLGLSSAEQNAKVYHKEYMKRIALDKDAPFYGLVRGHRGTLESALLMYAQDAWADAEYRANAEDVISAGTEGLRGKSRQEIRAWLADKNIGLELDGKELRSVGLSGEDLSRRLLRLGEIEKQMRLDYVNSSPKSRRLEHLLKQSERKLDQIAVRGPELEEGIRQLEAQIEMESDKETLKALRADRAKLKGKLRRDVRNKKLIEGDQVSLQEELEDFIANWGVTWHIPHVWETVRRPRSGLRGLSEKLVWHLLGERGHSYATRMKQGVSNRAKNPTGLPSHVPFRFSKPRLGKQGYSLSPVFVYDTYLRSLSHVVNMNKALEKLGAKINGIWIPGNIENLSKGDGYSQKQHDGGPGFYNGQVAYRGDWARVDRIEESEAGPVFTLSLQGEEEPIEVSGRSLSFLSRRYQGIENVMDDWSFREFQNYIDEVVFRKTPVDSQAIVARINKGLGPKVRGYFYHTMLGLFNLKSAANNIFGGQMMLLTEIGPTEMVKTWNDLVSNPVKVFRQAQEAGVLEAKFTSELAGLQMLGAKNISDFFKSLSFLPFSSAESLNRAIAYASGVRMARERGLREEDVHKWGMHTVARSQFLFTRASTPKVFRTPNSGLVSWKTAGFLWQYNVRFWSQMERWFLNKEMKQDHRGVGWWLWATSIPHLLRKTTGLDMRGVVATSLREIPVIGELGRGLEQAVGWHPDWVINNIFPILAPFDLAAVPVKVGWELLQGLASYGEDDQELAAAERAKILSRNMRYLVGRTPQAIVDLLNAKRIVKPSLDGKGNVVEYVVNHPHGDTIQEVLEEWWPGTARSGKAQRRYPELWQLIYSYLGAGMDEVDKARYDMTDTIRDIKHQESTRARIVRDGLNSGIRLMALGDPENFTKGKSKLERAYGQAIKWGYQPDLAKLRSMKNELKELYATGPDFYSGNVHVDTRAIIEYFRWDLNNSRRLLKPEHVTLFELVHGRNFAGLGGSGLLEKYMTAKKAWAEKYNGER